MTTVESLHVSSVKEVNILLTTNLVHSCIEKTFYVNVLSMYRLYNSTRENHRHAACCTKVIFTYAYIGALIRICNKCSTTHATCGQELFSLPEHQSSPLFQWGSCCSIFSYMRSVLQTIVCLLCCPFSFGLCIVCSSTIYGF